MNPLPSQLIAIGRGLIDPSRLEPTSKKGFSKRVARLEEGEESLGPFLASSPRLATLLAQICIAANMRDGVTLARLIHQAESLLDSLGWDWGDASPIINPTPTER